MLKMKKRCFLTTVLILVLFAIGRGESLPFKNYTTADGLGHDFVGQIARDSHGFLWFCTGEGLSRFDGYEFKNHTQADGLPHRNINDLLELDDGTYLVAASDGLVAFNPKGINSLVPIRNPQSNLMFRTFRSADAPFDKQPFGVNSLYQTRDKRIFATTFGVLFRVIRQDDGWRFQKIEPEEWRGKNIEFLSILEDKRGKIWITSSEGVWLFDEPNGKVTLLLREYLTPLIEDREGRIWGGIRDAPKGLSLFIYPERQDEPVLKRQFTSKDGLTDDR